jgi:hypothetical protein
MLAGGALALLGAAAISVGYVLGEESRALAMEGVEVPARVVRVISHGVAQTKRYRAFLEVEGQPPVALQTSVSAEQYSSLMPGAVVTVTYLPGQEGVVVLGGIGELDALARRADWAKSGGFALLVAGVVVSWRAHRARARRIHG